MKKRVLAVLLTAAMSFGLLAGCSQGTENSGTGGEGEASSEGGHIGMIFPALSSEMMVVAAETMEAAFTEAGYEVDTVSSDNDAAKEKQQLETFTSMGVDKLLVFPMGATAGELGTSLQNVRDQGIEVYVMGNKVDDGCFDGELIVDNAQVGGVTAETAARWIDETFPDAEDGSVKVGLVITTDSPESKAQSEALYQVEELTSKAKVVEVYAQSFTDPNANVQNNVEIMLEKHPDLRAILTYSEIQATTVNETIMSHDEIDKSQFGVFGSGISSTSAEVVKASAEDGSVMRGMVYYNDSMKTVDMMLGKLELDEENKYYLQGVPVTADNADEYIE